MYELYELVENDKKQMDPFLKWAGGKRWLLSNELNDLFPNISAANKYIEPFLGGGAVYFYLRPHNALLSDLNSELINAYQVIKDDWYGVFSLLKKYHKKHSNDFYYKIRAQCPRTPLTRAARFIYLNRTCWNGLYRVNQKGQFNVPIGTKKNVIYDYDNFEEIAHQLIDTEITHGDFEQSIDLGENGDFIFIYSPYTVKHNNNGFIKYNENIFSWEDQVRLKNAVSRAIERGVNVLILNACHESIKELYSGIGDTLVLDRKSVISGKSEFRGKYSELMIKSF